MCVVGVLSHKHFPDFTHLPFLSDPALPWLDLRSNIAAHTFTCAGVQGTLPPRAVALQKLLSLTDSSAAVVRATLAVNPHVITALKHVNLGAWQACTC